MLVRSNVASASRIDVVEDFDLGLTIATTLTIEDGGYVDVDGTVTIAASIRSSTATAGRE